MQVEVQVLEVVLGPNWKITAMAKFECSKVPYVMITAVLGKDKIKVRGLEYIQNLLQERVVTEYEKRRRVAARQDESEHLMQSVKNLRFTFEYTP